MRKKAAIVSLGCPKNQVDSEIIAGLLAEEYEIVDDPAEANIIIVNTCTFIEEAKEESVDVICEMIEYKNSGICEKVIAVGCMAQRYGKDLIIEIPELDGVLGDGNLSNIVEDVKVAGRTRLLTWKKSPDFLYNHDMPRKRFGHSFVGYIKIAEGCDNYCSYCVIPQIRGSYRSRPEESVLEEAKKMALEGVKEIILLAQDTTRYGLDIYGKPRLPLLLQQLGEIPGIEWIRLMYCYPDMFTDELIETIRSQTKICKYVDLPLQHADNKVLAEMNRRYTAEDAVTLINKLRNAVPDIVIRTTFITGFPGESEKEFNNLLEFVQKIKFDRLGVFAYSCEENTPAGRRKDQVPPEIREERRDKLMALQAKIAYELQQKRVGKIIKVILEEKIEENKWIGRSEGDAPEIDGQVYLTLKGNSYKPGDIVKARILQADSYDLVGEGIE